MARGEAPAQILEGRAGRKRKRAAPPKAVNVRSGCRSHYLFPIGHDESLSVLADGLSALDSETESVVVTLDSECHAALHGELAGPFSVIGVLVVITTMLPVAATFFLMGGILSNSLRPETSQVFVVETIDLDVGDFLLGVSPVAFQRLLDAGELFEADHRSNRIR